MPMECLWFQLQSAFIASQVRMGICVVCLHACVFPEKCDWPIYRLFHKKGY
jgi:hypothetical protein